MGNMHTAKPIIQADKEVREAILSQCKNFPNPVSAQNLQRLTAAAWFKDMTLSDKQRAAKSIAYLAEVGETKDGSAQQTIIANTLVRLLSDEIPLAFVEIADDPDKITFGYALPGTSGIYINKSLVPDGNKAYPKNNAYSREAILATIPHEVSHQVNNDINEATYEYFQAEYRAWYVGYLAENGKEPTRVEAFERCVVLINIYPTIHEALFDVPEERARMLSFMNQMLGVKDINLQSAKQLNNFLQKSVKNGNKAAPVPDASLNPDMDN